MVTDTFFDLQRFDDEPLLTTTSVANGSGDTIVGSSVNGGTFTWQNGSTFVNDGTDENPVYHPAATGGVSAVTGSMQISLNGTKDGYNFAVNEAKNDWNVDIKGNNTVTGDFSQGTGVYGLNGEVTVNVLQGKTFNETVNGSTTYVKAPNAAGVAVNVTAANTSSITYTFNNAANVAVGVDNNDTAIFNGGAFNVTLGAAANEDSLKAQDVRINGDATVKSEGTNVKIAVKDETWVRADNKYWVLDNKSARHTAEVVVNAAGDVASVSATQAVSLLSADGIDNATSVNIDGNTSTWNQITGEIKTEGLATDNDEFIPTVAAVFFDKDGAHINNYGAVTVKSATGNHAGFAGLDSVGVVANDVTIQAVAGGFSTFAVDLSETTGIDGIAVDEEDTAIKVAGDAAFEAKIGKETYQVATTADDITFEANENEFLSTVVSGKVYSVTGGDATFLADDVARSGKVAANINGAQVVINNNGTANDDYDIKTDAKKNGVDVIGLLKANDVLSVTGDSDGFTAVYASVDTDSVAKDSVVSFAVNNADISVKADDVNTRNVSITADGGNNVTVQGIDGDAVVSISGDVTYHFKNGLAKNTVTVGGAAYTEVTLTSGGEVLYNPNSGKVEDVIDDHAIPRKDADQAKWDERSTVGGATDTVTVNHADVYEDFYNLTDKLSGNTLAGYANQNDTQPGSVESAINVSGQSPLGTAASLGGASHITLTGDSNIGQVPINIQSNENPYATDVTINLTNATVPSSVAVGTTGTVEAAHNIMLGNAGTQSNPGYVFLGEHAKGENKISATGGYNVLRHDGGNRASITGGSGNDTIRGAVNDIVSGGASADFFYDYSGYALDYNVAEGDIIIASRLANLGEVTAANIRGNGNQVGFGNGEYLLTLGNIDQNAPVHVKVAVMDNNGNLLNGYRDVVLANGNGAVDATAAGENGALIVSNASRGAGVHAVIGSAGNDEIYVGSYDAVSGAAGDDTITIDNGAVGVIVAMSAGNDSVSGWSYGFDRAAGATQLNAGGAGVVGRVFEDRLFVSLEGGASMSFDDTAKLGNADQMHGEYKILVDDKKLTGIRNGDAGAGWADIDSNDEIADAYFAEREGDIRFTANVTQNLGIINLADPATYQGIRKLTLYNNSNAIVMGSADRETVALGGAAVLGANKVVSLGGGNDVIFSAGDDLANAGHAFYFGTGDGRDSVFSFNHYRGVNEEPDKGASDVIILDSLAGLKVEVDPTASATRVEFALNDTDQAVIYEDTNTYDYNKNMYHVLINNTESDGIAKIGYSTIANAFTYDKEVNYYIGSSGEARDTLVINATNENVEVRMDGQKQDGKFYRGIGVIDATAASYTNTTLAGSAANNMIIAGGEGTNNFLWGGAGSNTLVGGAGKDFFLYTKNANAYVAGADHSDTSGTNDLITGYDCNNDVIILSDVTLADINYAAMAQAGGNYGITENAVTVALNNGGSVTVDPTNQAKVTFYINDGAGQLTAFTANRETGAWSRG